jgi:GH15 family glucan-1,4-alpha-glucosidase
MIMDMPQIDITELDCGVIGNCRTAALVSGRGDIVWLCFPDFDSPSVFAGLVDAEKGGRFGFRVPDGYACSQAYLPETNILRTLFRSAGDSFEVLDFMPRYRISDANYYMPPEIYRFIRPVSGRPRVRVVYEPVMDYARAGVRHENRGDYLLSESKIDSSDNLYLYSSLAFEDILEQREFVVEKDEFLLLAYHQKLIGIDLDRVNLELERTRVYWMNWAQRSVKLDQYGEIVSRSLLALKLMTVEHSGAILAALTTSIPETIGESRNWDYRYCWLRDASMSIGTLLQMGHPNAARRFLDFIRRIVRSKHDSFQIMYGIRGERILTEKTLDHLAGFAGSKPVRIGNAAYAQKQNDAFGYLLDVIQNYYNFFSSSLDDIEQMWELIKKMLGTVRADWLKPDHSIWEFRNRTDHFVFSKVMCWVALDRGAKIASLLGQHSDMRVFQVEAEAVRAEIISKGWNSKIQSFTQAYGSLEVDASLLLMEQYGFISARDERFVKTVNRVKQELFHNGLVYRYTNSDDSGRPSSAFTICAFWLARALYVTDRKEEAVGIFENVTARCNHVGLLSEDLDFNTGRQLGNFPQAYSHLALIEVASIISRRKFRPQFIRP